jgi:hypothetical protein
MPTAFLKDELGYYILKDPQAVLDYEVKWTEWLDGDTIQTSTFTVAAGLTKDSQTAGTDTATVWLSGGTLGETYLVVNRVVTAGGRQDDREFRVVMQNK